MAQQIVLDLDCLIAAHEQRPDTKQQQSVWQWLSECSSVQYASGALIVPSATWERVTYYATARTCTCEAHSKGRYCWHREAFVTAELARENEAIEQAAQRDSYVDLYVADQARIGQFVTRRDRAIVRSVSVRAAVASGLSECF